MRKMTTAAVCLAVLLAGDYAWAQGDAAKKREMEYRQITNEMEKLRERQRQLFHEDESLLELETQRREKSMEAEKLQDEFEIRKRKMEQDLELRQLEMYQREMELAQPQVHRIVELQHGVKEEILESLSMFMTRGLQPMAAENLDIIALSGPANVVDEAEAVIKRFDISVPHSVEFFFYLVRAGNQSEPTDNPESIQGVLEQLKRTFPYQTYDVMDVSMLRMGDASEGSIYGNIQPHNSDFKSAEYYLRMTPIEFRNIFTDPVIEIREFQFGLEAIPADNAPAPPQSGFRATPPVKPLVAKLSTNFSIRDQQSVVLGKLSVEGTSDAYFVVVTANILE